MNNSLVVWSNDGADIMISELFIGEYFYLFKRDFSRNVFKTFGRQCTFANDFRKIHDNPICSLYRVSLLRVQPSHQTASCFTFAV